VFATFGNVKRAVAAVVVCGSIAVWSPASAGVFGGFSGDGSRYLVGTDRVCKPLVSANEQPTCEKAAADRVASMKFRKGSLQAGQTAAYRATATATSIEIRGDQGIVFEWSAAAPRAKVTAVWAEPKLGLVAVEYQTRLGGQVVEEAIAVRVATAAPADAAATGAQPADRPAPAPDARVENAKVRAAIDAGRKLAKQKKHGDAIARYDAALAIEPDHPEPRYWRAVSRLATGKTAEAVADLTAIRDSADPRAPEWMVEARFAKEFAKLRADAGFRAAVGLDAADRQRSGFERAVGLGGKWEQAPIPCEEPRVNLRLDRDAKRKFELVITSKCGDGVDRTRLSGTWKAVGTSSLHLSFPNQGEGDEGLVCKIEVCRDSSREDCIRCQPEPDLEFLLRVVRR
jgi:hypothetical protein